MRLHKGRPKGSALFALGESCRCAECRPAIRVGQQNGPHGEGRINRHILPFLAVIKTTALQNVRQPKHFLPNSDFFFEVTKDKCSEPVESC